MKEENLGIVIGTILSIDKINNTNRLFIVKIETGNKIFTIATSLASFYNKEDLIGKQVPIKIDVKPTIIMGVKSEARFIAIMNSDKTPTLLIPEKKVDNGAIVL